MFKYLIFCVIPFKLISQTANDSLKVKVLSEIVVSANRVEESKNSVAQRIENFNLQKINYYNAATISDFLVENGAISLQKSQLGGGSPILRGFEASRVLLVVDGIRMNNLIYRAGHLQNIMTIDQSGLERVEVQYGPSSTVYGSDALGGAIHLYTRKAQLNKIAAGGFLRRRTSPETTANINLNIGGKKLAYFGNINLSLFGDLKMGKKINPALGTPFGLRPKYFRLNTSTNEYEESSNADPYIQKGSGYEQADVLQKIYFEQNAKLRHTINFQYSTTSNLPRYDRLTETINNGVNLRFKTWYYGPQKRRLLAYNLNKSIKNGDFDLTISQQKVQESRHDMPSTTSTLRSRIENVNVWAANAAINKKLANYEVHYGTEIQWNEVQSTASQKNTKTQTVSPLSTRYPSGDNNMLNISIYTTESWIISDKFRIVDGLRLGISRLNSSFTDKTFYPFPYDQVNQKNFTYSGNIGSVYTNKNWKLTGMLSTGYRVPNIDDLSKVFDSVKGSVIVPNPNLKPEKTINYEIGLNKYAINGLTFESNFFYTNFTNAIVIDKFTFNGNDIINYDGLPSIVTAAQNKRKAVVYGFNLGSKLTFNEHFEISASYNYTKGRIKSEGNSPLDHIPPAFGRAGIRYSQNIFQIDLFTLWNGWKRIEDYNKNGEDNQQYAPAIGMPAWWTLNSKIGINFTKKWMLQAGIENITDLQYRTFSSGINGPGRNVFVSLRGEI